MGISRRKRPGPGADESCPKRSATQAVAFAAAALFAVKAHAFDIDGNDGLITETIAARERLKDYDNIKKFGAERVVDSDRRHVQPLGIRAGTYLIFPSVEEKIVYNDNIFGTSGNKTGDFRSELSPEIVFQSHLPRHVLNMALGGRLVSYFDNSDQDYIDGYAALNGALHIDNAHTLSVSLLTRQEHEELSDITASRAAAEPVPIWRNKAAIGITRDVGRLYGTASATYNRWDFANVDSRDGGTLDQSFRDQEAWTAQLQSGYRISPGFEIVSKIRFLRQLNTASNVAPKDDIDAYGYEASAGLAFQTSPLLRWRLLGGYGLRDYDEPGRDNVATSLLEGQFEWLPTQKMTIYGSVSRAIVDLESSQSGGSVETAVDGRLDYEIYNNIVLSAGATAKETDFSEENRSDRTYSGRIGLEYYLNKNWLFTFQYEHERRDSNLDEFDMDSNRFMVGAKLRF